MTAFQSSMRRMFFTITPFFAHLPAYSRSCGRTPVKLLFTRTAWRSPSSASVMLRHIFPSTSVSRSSECIASIIYIDEWKRYSTLNDSYGQHGSTNSSSPRFFMPSIYSSQRDTSILRRRCTTSSRRARHSCRLSTRRPRRHTVRPYTYW